MATIRSFFDLVEHSVEIYMNDFTPYGDCFEKSLENLEKVLKRCNQMHVSLSIVKFYMMMK